MKNVKDSDVRSVVAVCCVWHDDGNDGSCDSGPFVLRGGNSVVAYGAGGEVSRSVI